MAKAPKKAVTAYRHWVSFASGEAPFALVQPDRGLYDAFAKWLRGQGPQGHSFHNAGQEMTINFAHVQRMEVEEVREQADGTTGGLANPVPLTPPPPLE
jgi:hypothetical protein